MVGNVVALAFTLVFTRVLGQSGYGSLGALVSTFLILTVAGYALQTTVAREVSGAIAAGDPHAGRGVRRWLRHLALIALGVAIAASASGVPTKAPATSSPATARITPNTSRAVCSATRLTPTRR